MHRPDPKDRVGNELNIEDFQPGTIQGVRERFRRVEGPVPRKVITTPIPAMKPSGSEAVVIGRLDNKKAAGFQEAATLGGKLLRVRDMFDDMRGVNDIE